MLKQSEYNKKWREKNKEHVAEYFKNWAAENHGKRDKYLKLIRAKKSLQKKLEKLEALKKLIKELEQLPPPRPLGARGLPEEKNYA